MIFKVLVFSDFSRSQWIPEPETRNLFEYKSETRTF